MDCLENKVKKFANDFKLGVGIVASALSLMTFDLQAQTTQEKEYALKQVYPNAKISGTEYLTPQQLNMFVEQSKKLPSTLPPMVTQLNLTNKVFKSKQGLDAAGQADTVFIRGKNPEYNLTIYTGEIFTGLILHEAGGHLHKEYLQHHGYMKVLMDFDKIRGNVPAVSESETLKSPNAGSFYRWPDGHLGPTNGCITAYGTRNAIEDISECVTVFQMYPDKLADFLNPQGKAYDKRLFDKLEFLNKNGFIKPEAYNNIKQKAGIF